MTIFSEKELDDLYKENTTVSKATRLAVTIITLLAIGVIVVCCLLNYLSLEERQKRESAATEVIIKTSEIILAFENAPIAETQQISKAPDYKNQDWLKTAVTFVGCMVDQEHDYYCTIRKTMGLRYELYDETGKLVLEGTIGD